ncbi:MAG: PilZ domain-containing protein [Elusimicrobiota bacterium]
MSKEKRKHRRLPMMIVADIYNAETLELSGKGCVFDLSKTGIAFETNFKIDEKKPFFVRMSIPMEVMCEIMRAEEKDGIYRYGVKFSKLKMSDVVKIKDIKEIKEIVTEDARE